MSWLGRVFAVYAVAGLSASLPMATHAADSGVPPGHLRIESVEVHVSALGPVVLLKARGRAIPVFVDAVVAESIRSALNGRRPPRPLTHDLMHDVLKGFEAKVSQVVITLKDRIFYGALSVRVGDNEKVFDSRSSDAIALAIHFNAPILVSQELLDSAGMTGEPEAPNEQRL
jgi:hypothetical protein